MALARILRLVYACQKEKHCSGERKNFYEHRIVFRLKGVEEAVAISKPDRSYNLRQRPAVLCTKSPRRRPTMFIESDWIETRSPLSKLLFVQSFAD
jgi:hypothetical protein